MLFRRVAYCAVALGFLFCLPVDSSAEQQGVLTLTRALHRAVAGNPKLAVASREIGIATGKRIQAGAIPNPEVSFELDNAFGSGDYRGLRSAETTVQLSQAIELGIKRDARIAVGSAELESARWQFTATRLEILSDTAVAFFNVLAGQRKVQLFDAQVASLDRLAPLLQRRVDAGASSPGEIARINLAADLLRAERERARTALAIHRRELAMLMGAARVDFSYVTGDFSRIGKPVTFAILLQRLERNPQLIRWTAVRAQRDAELLSARLKPIPDIKVELAWRHFRRIGASIPIPVWDQNLGGITEAQAARAKVEAERAVNKATLILTLAKAYDTLSGALREIALLRNSAIPNAQRAVETIEGGYSQGRYTLLEVLDVQTTAAQAVLREQEALTSFHTSVATIEGLTGVSLTLTRERGR
jgi:cobalt-zinc-cadmium efflux system outer membrane protein